MRLEHDTIRDLGYLGVVAYGISFRRSGPESAVVASTIRGNYFGIFVSHADGVRIEGNRVVASHVYGIDPYGGSTRIEIVNNVVARSGLHGIVLANGVRFSRVERNLVDGARDHGVVLVNGCDGNTIQSNTIRGAFDGIVVTGSSANSVDANAVVGVTRFGLRVSHRAARNRFDDNRIGRALLGAYLYAGANDNVLRNNHFFGNYENVRMRNDARRNSITPRPARSEIP